MVQCQSMNQQVTFRFLVRAHAQVAISIPSRGACRRQLIVVFFLSHDVSLYDSPFSICLILHLHPKSGEHYELSGGDICKASPDITCHSVADFKGIHSLYSNHHFHGLKSIFNYICSSWCAFSLFIYLFIHSANICQVFLCARHSSKHCRCNGNKIIKITALLAFIV